jgi:hypothetical protein
MTLQDFKILCKQKEVPKTLNPVLLALWYDANNSWDMAHSIVQNIPGREASWIHAYLHRKKGDEVNASYWYSLAGKTKPRFTLKEEWETICTSLLGEQ